MLPGLYLIHTSRPMQSDLLSGVRITSERQFICFCPPPVSAGTVGFRNPFKNIWFAQHNFQNFNCYFFSSIWDSYFRIVAHVKLYCVHTRVFFLFSSLLKSPGLAVRQLTRFRFNKKFGNGLCVRLVQIITLLASLQLTFYCLVLQKISQTFLLFSAIFLKSIKV